jgi:SAM-dependent methyltransferase
MALPRGQQREALVQWLSALPEEHPNEAWNARFGAGSLFDAWTRSSLVRGLYSANATALRARLDAVGPGWRLVEAGGGDGRLWRSVLRDGDVGELIVIDPAPEVHQVVPDAVPEGVRVVAVQAGVEQTLAADFWTDVDGIVCSLTLHHLAGADAADRAAHGLTGPGKLEVLRTFAAALSPGGRVLLNEADIYCDLGLASGDPLLAERLMDSYVRRCAGALLREAEAPGPADADLRDRWRAIARHWCLAQHTYADVPVADRDVYELDVVHWLELIDRAGLVVEERGFTDPAWLFHRYVLRRA